MPVFCLSIVKRKKYSVRFRSAIMRRNETLSIVLWHWLFHSFMSRLILLSLLWWNCLLLHTISVDLRREVIWDMEVWSTWFHFWFSKFSISISFWEVNSSMVRFDLKSVERWFRCFVWRHEFILIPAGILLICGVVKFVYFLNCEIWFVSPFIVLSKAELFLFTLLLKLSMRYMFSHHLWESVTCLNISRIAVLIWRINSLKPILVVFKRIFKDLNEWVVLIWLSCIS